MKTRWRRRFPKRLHRAIRLAAVGLCFALAVSPTLADASSGPLDGRIIVLDPGHGGIDTGAIANGLYEKNVTLPISLDVGALLTQEGAHVIYTRTSDTTVGPADNTTAGLAARARIANDAHADVYISIHANSLNDPSFAGLMTFFGASAGYVDGVTRTPSVVDQSRLLAQDVQHSVQQQTGEVDRGVQSADFYVLGNTTMPSILIETGFLTNPTEARELATPAYQEQIAEGLAAGVTQFFTDVGSTVKQGLDANAERFVEDVTLPDHAAVSPGQTVTKTWKIANTGTTTWSSTYRLVLQAGGTLGGATSVALPSVSPGSTVMVSTAITAPSVPGDYSATWRLTAADGHVFGDPLWAEITVPGVPFVPFWAETTQATTLWTDTDPHADALTQLAQWSFLRVTGPATQGRYAVTEPVSHRQGYVAADAIGTSGPPPANYQPPAVTPPFVPFWVETTQQTALKSGPADPSATFGTVPQWSALQVMAPQSGSRLYVRNPATGGLAYVNAGAVGPSGPPSDQTTKQTAGPPASPSEGQAPATPPSSAPAGPPPPDLYVVKPGDTLFSIALHFHTNLAALAKENGLTDPNALRAGTTLHIAGTATFQPFWVENVVATPLWSGTDSAATKFGMAAQFTPMHVMAPATGGRYQVQVFTTGGTAYVDAAAVGPAGPPKGAE